MNIPLHLPVPVLSSTGVNTDKRVLQWIVKEVKTKHNKKAAWQDKIGMLTKSYVLSDRHQEIAAAWRKKTGFFLHIPVSVMMVEQRIMIQGKWRSKLANRKKRHGKSGTRYDKVWAWNMDTPIVHTKDKCCLRRRYTLCKSRSNPQTSSASAL